MRPAWLLLVLLLCALLLQGCLMSISPFYPVRTPAYVVHESPWGCPDEWGGETYIVREHIVTRPVYYSGGYYYRPQYYTSGGGVHFSSRRWR